MQVRKNQVPRGGIIKYGKIKYDCAGVENSSTEKQVQMRNDGNCKYGKMKYDWVGVENTSTNSAGKVKHNNSPIILRSGKQLSPFCVNLWNFKKSVYTI